MNQQKLKFMQAVRILAPGDQCILAAARRVTEERLPAFPGGAALEFVAAMERLKPTLARFNGAAEGELAEGDMGLPADSGVAPDGMPLEAALRIKSAEYWLKLGQPVEAMMELEGLPASLRKSAWAVKVAVSAAGAAREMLQQTVQE